MNIDYESLLPIALKAMFPNGSKKLKGQNLRVKSRFGFYKIIIYFFNDFTQRPICF
jgi:hypothetical protein